MWALSYSGAARSCNCGYSPRLLFVHACACHAGSVSLDTQGLDMEVTTTSLWTEAHVAQINCKTKAQSPQPVDMAEGLSCCSKKKL